MTSISIEKFQTNTGFKDYLAVIFRRHWIIVLSFLSVFLSTVYYVFQIEDIYESSSTLVIEEHSAVVNQMINVNRNLSFYEGILASRTFLQSVLDSIGMNNFERVFPRITKDEALKYIQNSLSLRKTTFTSFLNLVARAKTSDLAYQISFKGTEIFRTRCQEVASEESRRALFEIEKQLELIREKLENAEQDYRTFSDKTGQIHEGTTPELKTLQDAYASGLAQIGLKQADLDAEKKQLTNLERKFTPASNMRSPEYSQLRAKLSELEKERLRLEGLGIRLAGVSTIDREIQDIENRLLEFKQTQSSSPIDPATMRQWQELRKSVLTKEGELELFKRRLESYEKAIKSYKAGNPDILSHSLELLRLKRAKEIYENVYNILLEKAEEQRIRSASSSAGIKIVDLPVKPRDPIPKNETRFYLLGAFLGLALGLGLAFLIEFNDTTIKSNDDIERYLGISVLGTIPHIAHMKKNEVEVRRRSSSSRKGTSVLHYPRQVFNFEGDDSVTTESYRSLRTNLSFVSPDKPLKTIVLTSAGPSEGKSLTISNLAMAYAQMGKKTLLIDTDLRRPVLHHIFNTKREPGFTDLFMENPDYDRITKRTEKDNLFLITAGMFTPNPAELLGSNRMVQIIDYFRDHYDIVFFDTPPIVAVTDATLLGTKMDGLLIVIKSHHTDRDIALRAVNTVRNVGVRILGAVLNDINLSHRYSSYGYYKYYYHYYKSKKD
ncbi:MAG TPA: polysaccharide biosynthesis tyrosine autokinase [Chitinispirillaceae bacterium]|jgi:tyrosine-protein kinase Etk/Wzc|nr:polysaccharide biosynthesis tyrosine autokinase [Chitinispirillaceae bacterium]